MSNITTTDDKKEKIKKLREYHQPTLDALNVPNAIFIPKMAYKPTGKSEKYVGFFPNEINKGYDVYLEFCSKENEPEDPSRTLYKYIYNAHFEQEYEKTDTGSSSGWTRYLVPISELIVVSKEKKEEKKETEFELPDANTDLPLDQLTIRDLASILLKKPVSKKKWLNDIITQH